jgi:hypothetical protein
VVYEASVCSTFCQIILWSSGKHRCLLNELPCNDVFSRLLFGKLFTKIVIGNCHWTGYFFHWKVVVLLFRLWFSSFHSISICSTFLKEQFRRTEAFSKQSENRLHSINVNDHSLFCCPFNYLINFLLLQNSQRSFFVYIIELNAHWNIECLRNSEKFVGKLFRTDFTFDRRQNKMNIFVYRLLHTER